MMRTMAQSIRPNPFPSFDSFQAEHDATHQRTLAERAARSRAVNQNRMDAFETRFSPYGAIETLRPGVQWDPFAGRYVQANNDEQASAPGASSARQTANAAGFNPDSTEGRQQLENYRQMQRKRFGSVNSMDEAQWAKTGQFSDQYASYDQQSAMQAGAAAKAHQAKTKDNAERLRLMKDIEIDANGRPKKYAPFGQLPVMLSGIDMETAIAGLRSGRFQPTGFSAGQATIGSRKGGTARPAKPQQNSFFV